MHVKSELLRSILLEATAADDWAVSGERYLLDSIHDCPGLFRETNLEMSCEELEELFEKYITPTATERALARAHLL